MNGAWKKRCKRGINDPGRALLYLFMQIHNFFIDLKKSERSKRFIRSDLRELNEIKRYSLRRTDMSDHLITIFIEALSVKPKVIVELGVRGGESTFALERAARLCKAKLISVDLDDCSDVSSYENWSFIRKDDIEFAKEFPLWCKKQGIKPVIDIIFIDTSKKFLHTVQEIQHYFPYLSSGGKVFFHDTNMSTIYRRKDGSIGLSFYERGVNKALAKFFDKPFNGRKNFVDISKGWLIKHHSNSSGLTILEKGLSFK